MKKIVVLISILLTLSIFITSSSASLLFSDTKIYKNLPENSKLRQIFDLIEKSKSKIYNDNQLNSTSDTSYIDGENTANEDSIINTTQDANIIELNGTIGVEENLVTINENGEGGQTISENTTDKDGKVGQVLKKIIEIITEQNGKVGELLQKVVFRSYASSKEPNAEGIIIDGDGNSGGIATTDISNVVVEGDGGTATQDIANVVVVTSDQQP